MTRTSAARAALPLGLGIPLVLIFTLSGASGLAYEVLWTRQLTFVLGGSAIAVSTVLATFMAGLGLGGVMGGRWADSTGKPLLYYALAETGIGLFGLLTPALLSMSGALYHGLYGVFEGRTALITLARALAASIILLVPTCLMGATLPFMARFFIRRIDRLGRGLGLLYGVNVLGGVLGAGLVGYHGIIHWGVRASMTVAAAGNFAAAGGALVLFMLAERQKASGETVPEAAAPPTGTSSPRERLFLLGFAVSGFTSLAFQVLWTRILNFAIGNSVYAFTTILVVVLLGLFLGAAISGWIADRSRAPIRAVGIVQLLATAAVLACYLGASHLPAMTARLVALWHTATWKGDVLSKVIPAGALLFVPCAILGITFPLLLKAATQSIDELGNRIGRCYAVNTGGAILGSLLAGYVLLPLLGTERGILVVALLNLILAWAFLAHAERGRRAWVGVSAAGVALLLVWVVAQKPAPFLVHTKRMKEEKRQFLFHKEGRVASVAVTEARNREGEFLDRELHINLLGASVVDSRFVHQQYYTTIAMVPEALHPHPRSVFVAGLASGVTTGAAAVDQRVEKVMCVEISPEVIAASAQFDDYNFGVTHNPRVEIRCDDARAWLAATSQRFDVIVTDAFISALTGTAGLYSREYFEICKSRLAPGGYMSVGAGSLSGTDRTVAKTFCQVFPHVSVFVSPIHGAYNPVILIGTVEPPAFDPASIAAAFAQPAFATEMARYGWKDPGGLARSYWCTGDDLLPHMETTRPCTDDQPVIDFHAIAWAEGFVPTEIDVGKGPGLIRLRRQIQTRPFPGIAG